MALPKKFDVDWVNSLSDDEAKKYHQMLNDPQAAQNISSRGLASYGDPNALQPDRTFGGTLKDIGVTAAKGIIGAGEAAVGLANIPTLGRAGKFLEDIAGYDPEAAQDFLSEQYSPAQQAASKRVSEAEGFFGTVGTALQNPSTIAHAVLESTPAMIGGGLIGRGLIKAAPKLTALTAGAIGEGTVAGGMMAEDVRQQSDTGLITGKQAAMSAGAGLGTGIFGAAGARVAKRLGVGDIDTWLAGGKLSPGAKTSKIATEAAKSSVKSNKGVVSRIAAGGLTEGVFEELPQSLQEQVWMNAATDKPLGEGVGEAGAMGMLAGAAMGGGFSIFTQPKVMRDRDQAAPDQAATDTAAGETETPAAQPQFFTEEEWLEIAGKTDELRQRREKLDAKITAANEAGLSEEEQARVQAELAEEDAYWKEQEDLIKEQIKVREETKILETALKNDYSGTIQRFYNNPELLSELPMEVQENFIGMLAAVTGDDFSTKDITEIVSNLLSQNQRTIDSDAYFEDGPFEPVANDFAELTPEEQERIIKREKSALMLIRRQQEMAAQKPRPSLQEIEANTALDRFANRIENHLSGFIEINAQKEAAETPILEGPEPGQVIPIDYGEADPRRFDPFDEATQRLGGRIFPRPQDISPEAVEGYDPTQPVPRIGTNYQHLQPLATSIQQRDEMLRNPLTMEVEAANNNVDVETFRRQLIQDNMADRAALDEMARQADQNTPLTAEESQAAAEAFLMANQAQVRQLTDQLAAAETKAEQTEIQRQILPLLDEQKNLKAQLVPESTETEMSRSAGEQQVGVEETAEGVSDYEIKLTPQQEAEVRLEELQFSRDKIANINKQLKSNRAKQKRLDANDPRLSELKVAEENLVGERIAHHAAIKDLNKPQLEVRSDQAPGQGITLANIQATYPNQEVFHSEDGSFSVKFKNGQGVKIQNIQDAGDGFISFAIETGQLSDDGKILGVTVGNNILLDSQFADNATLWHENKHVLDNMGLITQDDDAALNKEFNRLRKAGELTFALSTHEDPVQAMRENRANTFAQVMLNRAEYRNKPLGTVIQRIMDFFQKLLSLGRQTVSGLAKEFETGQIYERIVNGQQVQTAAPQFEQTVAAFYSQLRNTVDQKLNKGSGQAVKNQVMAWANKGEFKDAELEWSGLIPWLEGRKTVTKQEVLDYLDANRVQIEVVEKSDVQQDKAITALEEERRNLRTELEQPAQFSEDGMERTEQIEDRINAIDYELDYLYAQDQTKFSQYQEPGGTNYKEILLTLPRQQTFFDQEAQKLFGKDLLDLSYPEADILKTKLTEEQGKLLENELIKPKDFYLSQHFNERNILAHVRMNERTGPNGERVLFLEEVQSDWHQAGRKKGYNTHKAYDRLKAFADQHGITIRTQPGESLPVREQVMLRRAAEDTIGRREINRLIVDVANEVIQPIPDAPFKGSKNWVMLAMKQMVRYAAENGFDSVAWTPGEVQVERYKQALRKAVDKIEWTKTQDGIQLVGYKDGQQVVDTVEKENAISDAIGKSMGDQIIESPQQSGTFEGDDITIADTGMAGFYDKILPAEVNKFFNKKSWGKAKVGQTDIPLGEYNPLTKKTYQDGYQTDDTMTAWSLPITDKMRSKALREGFPQFEVRPDANVSDLNTPTRDIPQEEYDRIHAQQRSLWSKMKQVTRVTKSDLKLLTERFLTPISTRLRNINPLLETKVRRLGFDTTDAITNQLRVALPLMEVVDSMSSADRSAFDWALKQRDVNRINQLTAKYGITENYNKMRTVMDKIHEDALKVGLDVGYLENYWPRILKDREGFLQATREISRQPIFSDALQEKAKKLGTTVNRLDPDLRADIISNIILNSQSGLGGPGNTQGRVFDFIPEDYAKFYMDSGAALMQYVYSMNKKIEARKFFGKVPDRIAKAKTKVRSYQTRLVQYEDLAALMTSDGQDTTDLQKKIQDIKDDMKLHQQVIEEYKHQNDYTENISSYVDELLTKELIDPTNEMTLKEILNARFNERGTTGIVNVYKNAAYIDTMGNPFSALTQIGDLAWAYYAGGLNPVGIAKTTKHVIKSIFKQSNITKEDLGFERIAQEFADSDTLSRAVSKVFKAVGLEKMDTIGKEALINTAYENYRARAEQNPNKLKKELHAIFGKETNSVVNDLLADDRASENVRFLMYSTVLDFQPMALSEMPEKYLTLADGRIFYMLKTFTIRQIDVFRREVFAKLRSDNPQEVMEGMQNLVSLAFVTVLANAGADSLKDLLKGKEVSFEDNVIENILTMGGASRYMQMQVRRDGAGSALFGQVLPPFKFIDSISRDVMGDTSDGLRSIDSVPVLGKLYYWHFGRGHERKISLAEQEFKDLRKDINKFKDKLDKAADKREFLQSNIGQFRQMKMVDNIQSSLNKNKTLINKLKDLPQTPNLQKRIAQLKQQREMILKNFFQQQNLMR